MHIYQNLFLSGMYCCDCIFLTLKSTYMNFLIYEYASMLSVKNSYAYEKNVVNACVKISIYNFNGHHHSEKEVPKLYI